MKAVLRWVALVLLGLVALQLYFVLRIAAMAVIDPESTTFQRSEAYRIAADKHRLPWRQRWVPYTQIADNLVVVQETYVDTLGEETTKDIEMRIRVTEGG